MDPEYRQPLHRRHLRSVGEECDAGATRHRLGCLTLVETQWERGTGRRGTQEIAGAEEDVLGILVMRRGRLALELDGCSVVLSSGQVILWDGAAGGSFRSLGTVAKRTLIVPRERLRRVLPHYESVAGRPLAADHPAARLIATYLEAIAPLAAALDPVAREAAADAAVELIRALSGAGAAGSPRNLTTALLTSIQHYIDEHLGDPSLSPATIAQANAISLRTLHRIFEGAGESVGAVIRERRLGRCHGDLLAHRDESITAIAYRWGFRDASHFSRVFRRRFGMSARELQACAPAPATDRPAVRAHDHEGTRARA